MSKVFAVMRREIRHTVMTKAFLIALVGVPILMVGAIAIAVVIMANHEQPPLEGRIVLIDGDGAVTAEANEIFARIRTDRRTAIERMTEAAASGDPESIADAAREAQSNAGPMGMGAMATPGLIDVVVEREAGDPLLEIPESLREDVAAGRVIAVAAIPPSVTAAPDLTPSAGETDADDEEPATGVSGPAGGAATNAPANDPANSATLDQATTATATPDADARAAEARRTKWRLLAGKDVDADHVSRIENAIGDAIVAVRSKRAGVDPKAAAAMLRRPAPLTDRVDESGKGTRESAGLREIRTQLIPGFFMMLLWIATFSSGTQLLQSTIEEKSNRVMEVLLSAVSPTQLLAGKILGQGIVGLLIAGVYSSLGLVSLALFLTTGLVSPLQIVAFIIFFLMAYFMVATMMAAVGSAVSDLRDANSLMAPVMIVLMIPMMLWMPISQAPNGSLATVISFVPPAIPFVMILRVCSDEGVSMMQLVASILWGGVCTAAMVWAAGRIFRVGVLMTGKPPSPLELIRWIRYT
ncbi:MAG: ABC transporter permease [Phycisphaerales bacterium]